MKGEPVSAAAARAHILSVKNEAHCTAAAIARAAGLSSNTVQRLLIDDDRIISSDTEARVLAVTAESLPLGSRGVPDEELLQRLIGGSKPPIPTGSKHIYHIELYRRGFGRRRIATLTRSSYESVRSSLLADQVQRMHEEVADLHDLYRSAIRREKSWQDYADKSEATVRLMLDAAKSAGADTYQRMLIAYRKGPRS